MTELKKKLPDDEFNIIDPKPHKILIGPRIDIIPASQIPPEVAALIMGNAIKTAEGTLELLKLLHNTGYENIISALMNESDYNKEHPKEFITRIGEIGSYIIEYLHKQTPTLTYGEMELTLLSVIKMIYKMSGNGDNISTHNKCAICPMNDVCDKGNPQQR